MIRHPWSPSCGLILAIAALVVTAHARPATAQAIVHDPPLYVQVLLQYQQLGRQLAAVQAHRAVWEQLARALPTGRPGQYVVPGPPWHQSRGSADDDLFGLYTALRAAIDAGDPTGQRWLDTGVALIAPPAVTRARLTPTQRLHRSRLSTHPLTSDGLGTMAIHALAAQRDGHQATSLALDRLDARLAAGDRGNPALLQQVAALDWHATHEDHLRNVYIAYLLEAQLANLKRQRDAHARALLADLTRRQHLPTFARLTATGTDATRRAMWETHP